MALSNRGYKRLGGFARVVALSLWGTLVCAAPTTSRTAQSDELVRSTLAQVESIAKKYKNLDAFGKETLNQAATLLDLGESALPILLKAGFDKRRDWKVRYWIVDMLGYVGNARTVSALVRILTDEGEHLATRLRAVDSLTEIQGRVGLKPKEFRAGLKQAWQKTKDRRVQKKIRMAIVELDRAVKRQGF